MKKALQQISKFHNEYDVQVFQKYLEGIQSMSGASRKFKQIASSPNKEQVEDYLAEIRYALVFAGIGFNIEIEPYGDKGPDLRVSFDSHKTVIEIMRFRKVYSGPSVLDLDDENLILPEYGNIPRDVRKSFEKISKKFQQVGSEDSIIAIWNDEEELDELEVGTAVRDLINDANRNILNLPNGLQFVLYGSKWARAGDHRQLHCFPCQKLLQPYLLLQQILDASTVQQLTAKTLA